MQVIDAFIYEGPIEPNSVEQNLRDATANRA